MLESGGYEVLEAEDGHRAQRLLEQQSCDLVVTDIFMPEKEGLATILDLKKTWPELRIIAISGGSPRVPLDVLSMAQRFGAARTLKKPLLRREFLGTVAEVLAS